MSNDPEANLFGVEPNFGCCTTNMHQDWPKLVQSLWMSTPDQGVAAMVYAPNVVRTIVAGKVPVTIDEDTDYPFRGTVRFVVTPAEAVQFPLLVRIPSWATEARVLVNGAAVTATGAGTFTRIDRRWARGDRVELRLTMVPRVSRWFHGSAAIERGPLVFALRIRDE